jgi:glyoxylase-like metal-dependent hydrolase (beta-lactamase superfamily II)
LTVIDTGFVGNTEAVLGAIGELGRRPADLGYILLTHRHRDHTGSASELRAATGARIVAHWAETRQVDGATVLESLGPGRTPVDLMVEDGEVLETGISTVHTPGHTAGSACFLLPDSKTLFLGDLAINNIERLSRPLPYSNDDETAYEESLRKVASMEVETGYFGHGPPLMTGLKAALEELVSRPRAPTWLRMVRGWRDLIRFSRGMRRD